MKRLLLLLAVILSAATALAGPATQPTTAPATQPAAHGWPDRRPVTTCMLAMSDKRTPQNPRGWIDAIHAGLDVHDPDYRTKFSLRLSDFFAQCVKRAKDQDAQLIWLYDIEGQENDHPVTYAGDPVTGLTDITRENLRYMVWLADRENIGVAFTFRATAYTGVSQAQTTDPVNYLAFKINGAIREYGKNVRGAYLDSLMEANGTRRPWDVEKLRRLRSLVGPDVLLIPEFNGVGYADVPGVFPLLYANPDYPFRPDHPFVVIKPTDGTPTAIDRAALTKGARQGGIPLVSCTWDAPLNQWVLQAYRKAHSE